MQVKEIMTANPAVCEPEASLQDVARMMADRDCGAIPVVRNHGTNELAGIVTDRDITIRSVAAGKNPLELKARDVMSPDVIRIKPDEDVQHLARLMEKNQIRRVVVEDGGGCCVGIVAQADLARHASDEVTGEVVEDISKPTRGTAHRNGH